MEQLLERAQLIEAAAAAAAEADAREQELREVEEKLASSADVRFGELLCKRKIKPGEEGATCFPCTLPSPSSTGLPINSHLSPYLPSLTRRPPPIPSGAVVTYWSKSRGEHAGELSKSDFVTAVIALGLTKADAPAIEAVFEQ